MRQAATGLAALAGLGLLAAGCGGGNGVSAVKANPQTLLRDAQAEVNAASAVHFTLNSSNVPSSGTDLTGGSGDLVRPDELQGSFSVTVSGFGGTVKVASKGGVFEALLPFQTKWQTTNPANFGLTNPAELIDPNHGLASLLTLAQNPRVLGQERLAGELVDLVTYTIPGSSLPVLPDAKPSVAVDLTVAIDPSSHQLRQVSVTGPLISAGTNSTYIVTLTNYNEHVSITLPPTS